MKLAEVSAACRVHFTWLGTRKTLTADQKEKAAAPFSADGDQISASKRLLNTKHERWRAVSGIRAEARAWWVNNTLPFPEKGIRLIRRDRLDEFAGKMAALAAELEGQVRALDAHYDELRTEAKEKLGTLFNPLDYPGTLEGCFKIEWDLPSVEPPDYLAQLNPALFEQEKARMIARFEEAGRLAEQGFAEELAKLTSHIAERLTDGPEGRKVFRDSAIENLNDFFDRFKALSVTSDGALDKLVEDAKKLVAGVDAKDVRKDESLRTELAKSMAAIAEKIDTQIVVAPKRRIAGIQGLFDGQEGEVRDAG
jgi:hypothetical protein